MKLVITGGHHSSALPIIHKIRDQKLAIDIYWIGHKHSLLGDQNDTLEYKEITSLNIPFYDLQAGKVYKSLNLKSLLKILFSLFQSFKYLHRIKPDVILSFGGYLAVPVVVAGWVLRIPSVTHEQTVVAGYANRLISHFVKKVMISWKDSEKYFPKGKAIYTGIPLRESIFTSKSNSFSSENNLPYVYVTAGKTGSIKINATLMEALPQMLMFCNVIHQCGDYSVYNSFDQLTNRYDKIKNALHGRYFIKKFIFEDEIGEVYFRASLIVGRSGAHTISEILALEKPALLIPISWVSHNEQNKNALMIKNAGLAEILAEKDLTPEAFTEKIKYMLHNKNSYVSLRPDNFLDSATLILNEVLKYAKN